MRRIWLLDVGLFEIIPNSGNGSCLFQAISQALTFSTKFNYQIRTSTVEHMTSRKWAHKLNQIPDFWKHIIVTQWLRKEKEHFTRRDMDRYHHYTTAFPHCCLKCIEKFIERRRKRKYLQIKKIVKTKRYNRCGPEFRHVFRQFMSKKQEPGTRFELEAAASVFHFHFDYLQAVPKSMILSKALQLRIEKQSQDNCCDDEGYNMDGLTNDINVEIVMYQFHSCRTNGCQVPRSLASDLYYFLHSSLPNCYASEDKMCGHWELLRPIFITRLPVPLNRRVIGVVYEISESDRCFVTTPFGERRERIDLVGQAIQAYVQRNSDILPLDDPDWPAGKDDDYVGCARALKNYLNDEQENYYPFQTSWDCNGDLHADVSPSFLFLEKREFFSYDMMRKWKAYRKSKQKAKYSDDDSD